MDVDKRKNFLFPSEKKEGLFEVTKTSKIGRRVDI